MALKKSTVLWAVPGDREEETEIRKRAYGNYLKNRSSSGTTNLQGAASTGFLGGGQKAGRPSLTSSAAPPWELKDLGKEMQKFQNTQQTLAAEQTTSLPAVPSCPPAGNRNSHRDCWNWAEKSERIFPGRRIIIRTR